MARSACSPRVETGYATRHAARYRVSCLARAACADALFADVLAGSIRGGRRFIRAHRRVAVSAVAWLIVVLVLVLLVVLIGVFVRRRRRGGGVIATRRKR